MKMYDTYKDSGIEWMKEIPANWDIKPLKSTTNGLSSSFMDGDWIESPVITDDGIRYLTTGNVGVINYKEQGNGYISEKTFNDLNCSEVFPGDVLISRLNLPLSRACIVPNLGKRIVTAVDNVIYRPNEKECDSRYMVYLLNSPRYAEYVETLGRGTTMKRVSRSVLCNVRVCVPPLPEQRAIAAYLDHKVGKIDASVAAIDKQIDDLKAYRQSIISEAVTKGLDPNAKMKDSGVEWIGEIPEGWNVVPLKHYLSLKGRIGWNGLKSEEFEEISYAYLVTGQDFNSANVDWSKCYQINKKRYDEDPFIQLENGDLLVTKDGTIGKIAKVVNLDKPACLNSGIFVVKQTAGIFNQNYLYWTFVSNQLKEFVGYNSTGSTIQHLYQNVFENMPLAVPSLPEQHAIATYLDTKTSKIAYAITSLEQQRNDLEALKQSVISEAVTGKVDVRDWKPQSME